MMLRAKVNIRDLAPSGRQHSCCPRVAAALIWYAELSSHQTVRDFPEFLKGLLCAYRVGKF
jgi:hypothetical protein